MLRLHSQRYGMSNEKPPPTVETVFRVTEIPLAANVDELKDTLSSAFPGEGVTIKVTMCPSCYGKTKTALVHFTPRAPSVLDELLNGSTYEIAFRNSRSGISIDKDFYGLTQLYPTEGEAKADIVAVAGLNGHAYGSWRGRQLMWLHDFLPEDLPRCRAMIYGYNSGLTSNSIHAIPDYTDTFLEELIKARRSEKEKNRPIVFIDHSFGGIIIAQSIVKAKDGPNIHGSLFQKTRATIFFGTPHRGLVVDDILATLGQGSPKEELVASISDGSKDLSSELRRFVNYAMITGLKIVSFKEIEKTRKLERDENGRWSRSGEYFMPVDSNSSVLQLPNTIEESLAIEGDHSTMVKFEHSGNLAYTSVVRHLRNFTLDDDRFCTAYGAVIGKSATDLERILEISPSVVNERQENDTTTLLHMAIGTGDEETVSVLLKHQADIEAVDEEKNTAFHLAVRKGYREVVGLLLENGAKIDAPCKGMMALHLAAQHGHENLVMLLVKNGANIAVTDEKKRTALHLAALEGHKNVAKVLLGEARIITITEAKDEDQSTALHLAAQHGHEKVVKVLLKKGADIAATGISNYTALHLAARHGHEKVVEVLLVNRGEVTEISNYTALHLAAQHGHEKVVEVFLKHGVDITATDKYRYTALYLAAQQGHKEVVEILLTKGTDIDRAGDGEYTALHFAAQHGHVNVVEVLLKNRVDIAAANQNQYTALHLAAQHGHEKVVEVLLVNRGEVNAIDIDGRTALHLAAWNRHEGVIRLLLAGGADVESKDNYGQTALDVASVRRFEGVGPIDQDKVTKLLTGVKNVTECTVSANDISKIPVTEFFVNQLYRPDQYWAEMECRIRGIEQDLPREVFHDLQQKPHLWTMIDKSPLINQDMVLLEQLRRDYEMIKACRDVTYKAGIGGILRVGDSDEEDTADDYDYY